MAREREKALRLARRGGRLRDMAPKEPADDSDLVDEDPPQEKAPSRASRTRRPTQPAKPRQRPAKDPQSDE